MIAKLRYWAHSNKPTCKISGKFIKVFAVRQLYFLKCSLQSQDKFDHCARRNGRTAHMFANARKEHSIPLTGGP